MASVEEYRLLQLGDERYATTPADYEDAEGNVFRADAGLLSIGEIPLAARLGNQPFDFAIADPSSALLADILDESLRGRTVTVWSLDGLGPSAKMEVDYFGYVANAAYRDRSAAIRAGSWFSGFETTFPRRTTTADQKALHPNDTCCDRIDGGNAAARAKFNWESD